MIKKTISIFLLIACFTVLITGCKKDKSKANTKQGNITLGDYKNISVTVTKSRVTEQSVKSYIERMAGEHTPEGASPLSFDDLTDEFVATNMQDTECKTVAELKQKVSDYLNELNDYYAENNTRSAIVEKLSEICTVKKIPDDILKKRVAMQEKIFKSDCIKQYGMEYEEYLTANQITEDDFHNQTVENVKDKLKSELILLEIAKREKIEVSKKQQQEYAEQMLESYGYESTDDLYAYYSEEYIKNSCICDKVLKMLTESTKVTFVAPGDAPGE